MLTLPLTLPLIPALTPTRYIFASQQPPPVMQLENKRVRQMCTPALETLHEVQDPSLGCCYAGGRSAQAPSWRP
jgi:hypothetical protein